MLIHLSKAGAKVSSFTPDILQDHVTDHSSQMLISEKRNALVESARISRGEFAPISLLKSDDFDALLIPGGFGAASTLSDFEAKGGLCKVIPEVERVLKVSSKAKKHIALCCIAPVLAARCLPGVHVTVGKDPDTAKAIQNMGAVHENRGISEVCIDENHRVVTAPAYMYGTATLAEIFDNIGLLVKSVLLLTK